MHRANNAVVMQTEQLGRIEALEEDLRSSKAKMVEMEQKMMEQDHIIAQLVGDNLDHLQDNMWLTAHINSSNERLSQMEHRLGQVRSVVMGFLEGRLESLMEEEKEEEMTVIGHYFCIYFSVHFSVQLHFTFLTPHLSPLQLSRLCHFF